MFSSQRQDSRFSLELAYRSHVAHNKGPVLFEGLLCCEPFGRDYIRTADLPTLSALREKASPPTVPHICTAEFRKPARSWERAFALLKFCCLAQRSRADRCPSVRVWDLVVAMKFTREAHKVRDPVGIEAVNDESGEITVTSKLTEDGQMLFGERYGHRATRRGQRAHF